MSVCPDCQASLRFVLPLGGCLRAVGFEPSYSFKQYSHFYAAVCPAVNRLFRFVGGNYTMAEV